MNYQQSVEYVENAALFGSAKHGLENITELLNRLGNPQEHFASIHVAGTNGKGSICAALDSVLRCQGYKTGLYTSPYLEKFTERIRIGGEEIAEDVFAGIATRVRSTAEAMVADGLTHPTFFELVTACCFLAFAEAGVEIAVVETGLGGRLDATNVIHPVLTVIAAIGLDHVKVLGDTVEAIAREKAGIFKEGVPAVIYPQPFDEAYAELLMAAKQKQVPVYAAADASILVKQSGLDGQCFGMRYQGVELGDFETALLGQHQILNMATAVIASLVLSQDGVWKISTEALRKGIAGTRWPGRMEIVSRDPLTILDGGHNPQGTEQLVNAIKQISPNHHIVLLYGALHTKDVDQSARILSSCVDTVICTTPPSYKAFSAQETADAFREYRQHPMVVDDPVEALSKAQAIAKERHSLLVITGSLYLVGALRGNFF